MNEPNLNKKPKVSFVRQYLLISVTSMAFCLFSGFVIVRVALSDGKTGREKLAPLVDRLGEGKSTPEEMKIAHSLIVKQEVDFPKVFIIIALSLLCSIGGSAYGVVYYMKKKANLAELVMEDIKAGKLDSRFPTEKFDEFTRLMGLFNEMADRIKELVLKLREVDQTRKELLQEISHDLKTPLSSLLMSFDSIERRPDMTADKKNELLQEARGETEYISILLDDLLFLSVVEDPAFHIHPSNFNFSELVEEVIKLAQQKFPHIQVNLELTPSLKLNADSVLIKRALRNLIENSFSFCIQKIQIKLSQNSLEIIDDGPGFHPEILENFGKKRLNTVRISDESGQRKSTGLGAVIANRILKHHHFDLLASNEISDNKQISGAKLLIKFS